MPTNLPVPYPAPSAVTSVTMTSAFYNANVRDAIGFLTNPPICQLYASAAQSIAAGTWTMVNLDTVVVDSYSGFNASTHRYTAAVPGWYEVFGNVPVAAQTSTIGFFAGLYKNGAAVNNASGGSSTSADNTAGESASIQWQIYLNVGDYVDLRTWVKSAMSTFSNGLQAPNLNLRWIHY